MNPKLVALTNGDTFIADVEIVDETLTANKPVVLQGTENGVGFVHWPMLAADESISVEMKHVVYLCNPQENIKEQYVRATGGIITPSKSLII